TAAVAGLAALWLAHYGRKELLDRYTAPLLPFAFRKRLCDTAARDFEFVRDGKGGFGTGVVDAVALLEPALEDLPDRGAVGEYRKGIMARAAGDWLNLTLSEFVMLLRVPTTPPDGSRGLAPEAARPPGTDEKAVRELLKELIGNDDEVRLIEEL